MPRAKTMPCAICKEPMWKGRTSKPEGEAAHNACKKALPQEQRIMTCVDCQVEFTAARRSSRCNACRYVKAKAEAKADCISCDNPAITRGMCTTHYSYWHHANKGGRVYKKHSKECAFCASPFATTTKGTMYCSLVCAQRQRAGWSTGKDIVMYVPPTKPAPPISHVKTKNRMVCGTCKVCDSSFVSFYRDITCSNECQGIYRRSANMEHKHRRRARKRDAFVAPVFRKRVFESDGYRCHICNKMTKKTAVVPHPMAPTLDHLVPLAKGGTHEPINCRTAHFMCNSIKGDRLAGDQLLLFAM